MIKERIRQLRRTFLFAKNGYRPRIAKLKNVRYFGTEYGGWPLVTDLLNETSTVFSFGLGRDISFDLETIKAFNMVVHGFDPTPRSAEWISQQALTDKFKFHQVGVADFDGDLVFQAPENSSFVSFSSVTDETNDDSRPKVTLPVKRLSTLMAELQIETLDVLKMDIEGSENSVIEDVLNSQHRPVQILVEFHHRILDTPFDETKKAIQSLEAAGYTLFDISSLGDEYSFVLKEAVQ